MKTALRLFVAALALVCGCARAQVAGEELFRSIENGDFSEFSRLVGAGALVSAKNRLGESPLYVAAEKGRLEMARALIAAKADARALTPNGETVLHAAAMIESAALMAALIEAGAQINAANPGGETPPPWGALTGTLPAGQAPARAAAHPAAHALGTRKTP